MRRMLHLVSACIWTAAFVAADFDPPLPGDDGYGCDAVTTGVCWYNCTVSAGFWKTHSETWPPGLAADDFYLSGTTWLGQFEFSSTQSGCYFKLAHQYVAAVLNWIINENISLAIKQAVNVSTHAFEVYSPSTMDGGTFCSDAGNTIHDILASFNGGNQELHHCIDDILCDADRCTIDFRDHDTGECSFQPNPCSDSSPCTADSCDVISQQCVHVVTICTDGLACTVDQCLEGGGCAFIPVDCDDGNPCTIDDRCEPLTGECVYAHTNCSDDDPCTEDEHCDTSTGQCVFTLASWCTSSEVAEPTSSSDSGCDDGNECTVNDRYDVSLQACVYDEKDCSNGDPCSIHTCAVPNGTCIHAPKSCQPHDACMEGGCNNVTGDCESFPLVCPDEDGDSCTIEVCNVLTGQCETEFFPVDDGDPCTDDTCIDGFPVNFPKDCNDFDPCRIDACSEGVCTHTPRPRPRNCYNATCAPCDPEQEEDCIRFDEYRIAYRWAPRCFPPPTPPPYEPPPFPPVPPPTPPPPPVLYLLFLLLIPVVLVPLWAWWWSRRSRRTVTTVTAQWTANAAARPNGRETEIIEEDE